MTMFSSRIHWNLQPSRIAAALSSHTGALLDLTQSNPTTAQIEYPRGLLEALTDVRALQYSPLPAGLLSAREAVSRYYKGVVDPDRILLAASTSEAYSWLFKLLCDPGDEVLVPRPSYPLFEFLAHLEGVRTVQFPMHYDHGWFVDVEALRDAATDRTRAVIFVNPNNPTGSFLKKSDYEFLAAFCADRGLALIVDEVFCDFAFGPDNDRVATVADKQDVLTFVLSGLSKISGLPQMKLGWIVVNGPAPQQTEARRRLELIADTFLSVGGPVQYALPKFLEAGVGIQKEISTRTAANLEFFRNATTSSFVRLLEPEAGWSAIVQVPRILSEEEWILTLLRTCGVLVQPGFFYDFGSEAFLIVSLLTEPGVFREGVRRTILACEGQTNEC
ncbi:MAG: pyridoxal phosphate-dependent aminotransferase [Bryobacteraceae bacterium]|nr:pyridoxal phosphate-dependent aminotransferase [Bryobacteraceae bacterium]